MPGTMLKAYGAQAIAFSQLWVDAQVFFVIVVTMIISTLHKKGQGPKTCKWHVQIFITRLAFEPRPPNLHVKVSVICSVQPTEWLWRLNCCEHPLLCLQHLSRTIDEYLPGELAPCSCPDLQTCLSPLEPHSSQNFGRLSLAGYFTWQAACGLLKISYTCAHLHFLQAGYSKCLRTLEKQTFSTLRFNKMNLGW